MSAFFNGDGADIRLFVAPNDSGVSFSVDKLMGGLSTPSEPVSLTVDCPDNRVPDNDPRIGRFVTLNFDEDQIEEIGTAFITQYGNLLTAGHLIHNTMPMRVQFNVPESDQATGHFNFPIDIKRDQYAVEEVCQNCYEPGPDPGPYANDWAVFTVTDNEGYSILWRDHFDLIQYPSDGNLKVSGYGQDYRDSPDLRKMGTLQAATGIRGGCSTGQCTEDIIYYKVYIDHGVSGSPIILTDVYPQVVIGIATKKFCDLFEYNVGTSFYKSALWDAVRNVKIKLDQVPSVNDKVHISSSFGPIHIGHLHSYQNGIWSPEISLPATLTYTPQTVPQNFTLLAWDEVYNYSSKFHDWNSGYYALAGTFPLSNSYVSYFTTFVTGINIQNELIGAPNLVDGIIYFKDPWFVDGTYLEKPNNTFPSFKERVSPFHPDLNTSYEGIAYKGVFLNQGGPDPNNLISPYYSIRAPLTQIIGGVNAVFDHWAVSSTNGINDADIVDINDNEEGYNTKAVIFRKDNAVVKAMYRSQIPSNINAGWNLVSLPVSVANGNNLKNMIWPGASSDAFAFEGIYVSKNEILNGPGYWIKYDQAPNPDFSYLGTGLYNLPISVLGGWNMIGSISS